MQISSTVESSIPILSEAVSSIIRNSAHEEFQQTCLSLISADLLEEADSVISNKLKSMAQRKLGVRVSGGAGLGDIKGPEVSIYMEQLSCFKNHTLVIGTYYSRVRASNSRS